MRYRNPLLDIGLALFVWLAACSAPENKGAAVALPVPVAAVVSPVAPKAAESPAERTRRVHRDAIVVDAHSDTAMRITDEALDLGTRSNKGHLDLPRLTEGGVDVQVFAAWVDPEAHKGQAAVERARQMLAATTAELARHADRIALGRSLSDVRAIVASGRVAALLAIEGGYAIGDDPTALDTFYELGVRIVTLTWWNDSSWADGSGEGKRHHGLSEIGRAMVRRMNELGIIIDVSHASDEAFRDVLALTVAPVIASHSNSRAVCDHHRNLSDDMVRALAQSGGVMGMNYASGFVDKTYGSAYDALRDRLRPQLEAIAKQTKDKAEARQKRMALFEEHLRQLPPPPVARVADHIDHLVALVGPGHVGLGSDFDGFLDAPRGLEDASKLPELTALLLERGHSEEDVARILGGNFLRVLEVVEKRAAAAARTAQ